MKGLIKYYSIVFFLFFVTAINAQSQKVYNLDNDDASLVVNYKDLLLSACDEDMNKAFNIWMETLGAIESYASAIGFEKIKKTQKSRNRYSTIDKSYQNFVKISIESENVSPLS